MPPSERTKVKEWPLQWHVERIADKVSAISATVSAISATGDAAAEPVEHVLYFDRTGWRSFSSQIDGKGPMMRVTFDLQMKRAFVMTEGLFRQARVVDADAHSVASALLDLAGLGARV
jgi:hypothetical protein